MILFQEAELNGLPYFVSTPQTGQGAGQFVTNNLVVVLQHTAAVVSAKSYMCPVCGRALSSPGSLGRHLLIHSEDQLSNCAVCGARFTSHATFNRSGSPWLVSGLGYPQKRLGGLP